MNKIDTHLAATVMPTFKAVGPNPGAYFGPNSTVDCDYVNMLQEEICAVIAYTGASLSKTAYNQLLAAINVMVNAAVASGIPNVQADVVPKLGANLKTNGFQITSGSNINGLNITPYAGGIIDLNSATVIVSTLLAGTPGLDPDGIDLAIADEQHFQNSTSNAHAHAFDVSNSGLRIGEMPFTTHITTILDEDDFVSDSATATITQQSAKAYVDAFPNVNDRKYFTITHNVPIKLLALTYYYFARTENVISNATTGFAYAPNGYALRLKAGTISNIEICVGTALASGESASCTLRDGQTNTAPTGITLTNAANVYNNPAFSYHSSSDMYIYLEIYAVAGVASARNFTYSFTYVAD